MRIWVFRDQVWVVLLFGFLVKKQIAIAKKVFSLEKAKSKIANEIK
jgi:hypothetical protein